MEFEGVYRMDFQLTPISKVLKGAAAAGGVHRGRRDTSPISRIGARNANIPEHIAGDFENEQVKCVIIGQDVERVETVKEVLSVSRLCIINHVPFIIVPSKRWMARALRADEPSEMPAYVVLTDLGKAEASLAGIVDRLKEGGLPIWWADHYHYQHDPFAGPVVKIARLTGKVTFGAEAIRSIQLGMARLVLISRFVDSLQEDSREYLKVLCKENNTPFVYTFFDQLTLGLAVGALSKVPCLAITDLGAAEKLIHEDDMQDWLNMNRLYYIR
jgi:ribosomal protein L7Ae-like RNA K-turn-binding protein